MLLLALAAPVIQLNVARLPLLALATQAPLPGEAGTRGPAASVPAVMRSMPLAAYADQTRVEALWISARYARLLEFVGQASNTVGCAWDAQLCRMADGVTRLTARGHVVLAEAVARGAIGAHSRLDAEVALLSCIEATPGPDGARVRRACGQRLAVDWPEIAPALLARVPVIGSYAPELSELSARPLAQGTASPDFGCSEGLAFLRSWVHAQGVTTGQLESSRALAGRCPSSNEIRFYHARSADLAGLVDEARLEYEASGPSRHPEAAFWLADFRSRTNRPTPVATAPCDTATTILEESSLPARYEDGSAMGADTIVNDPDAADGHARASTRFGTVLAYGPYLSLPHGQYTVSFLVRSSGASAAGRVVRLDVRQDNTDWRIEQVSRILQEQDLKLARYQRIAVPFTSIGQGTVSFAVVTLTASTTWFDRLELRRDGCS